MSKQWSLIRWLALPALVFSLFATTRAASAQTGGTVVASGLWAARGITFAEDGSMYVADAGKGGADVYMVEHSSFTRGYSGKIVKVAPDGTQSVVARNLPSEYAGVGYVTGPEAVIWAEGALWTVTGVWLDGHVYPGEGALLRIDASTGISTTVADLGAYEMQANPNGFYQDADPYGLVRGADGFMYVADAAANDILKVDPRNGQISTVAVIPGMPVSKDVVGASGNPVRGGANELDPVPTGLDFGPDGALYASLLSGFPMPEGLSKVVRVSLDGKISDMATGLTMATDVKYGPDGAWYVVSIGKPAPASSTCEFCFVEVPNSGQVLRITASGQRQVLLDHLNLPNMVDFDKSGNMYVSVNSYVTDANGPPQGQVLRFSNVIGGTSPAPGMPRTGAPGPFADLVYFGLLLFAVGFALRWLSTAAPHSGADSSCSTGWLALSVPNEKRGESPAIVAGIADKLSKRQTRRSAELENP